MSEDLIKRSDAIKAIEAEECLGYVECQSKWLYDRIKKIPTVKPAFGEWTPCFERLPEVGITVLVQMREGLKQSWEEQRLIEFGRISPHRYDIDGCGWEWLDESGADFWAPDVNDAIIAWAPLPEPYKEKEKLMADAIKVTMGEINATVDCEVMKAVQRVGISVDRESLIKALRLAEKIVYCKDCKWRDQFGCALEIADESDRPNDDDYCSFGERKEADE